MSSPWTKLDFVELWKTLFPASYIRAMEESAGFDWIEASAAVFARADGAISSTQQRFFIKPHSQQRSDPASAGDRSRGDVTIRRANTVGAFTVPAGTIIRPKTTSSYGGELLGAAFTLSSAVAFADGEDSKVGTLVALSEGEFANIVETEAEIDLVGRRDLSNAVVDSFGLSVDVFLSPDTVSSSDIGRLVALLDGPASGEFRTIEGVGPEVFTVDVAIPAGTTAFELFEYEDIGISAGDMGPTIGGKDAWLDALGRERRVSRRRGEVDSQYRSRVCGLSDTISIDAVRRAAARVLSPLGIPYVYKDFSTGLGFVLDHSAYDTVGPDGNWRLLANARTVRYFVICVGISNAGDIGFPYDHELGFPPNFYENALDEGFLDGHAFEWNAALGALFDSLDDTRAGGIAFDILIDPTL